MANTSAVVLFDGVCNFCDRTVQFILARDRKECFKFAPLQSQAAQTVLTKSNLPTDQLETMVLVEGQRCYVKSGAFLRILRQLGGLWWLLYVFIIIPRPIRDFLYDCLASRRYRWFGKKDSCMVPTPDVQRRFLNK